MLNQTGITKTVGSAPVQILFNVQNQMAVSIKVDDGITPVTENGRKIIKAGTPLSGDLKARSTAFVAAKKETSASAGDGKVATGILLHDVDITDGDANGSLLIWGFVNLSRIDTTTAAKITADVETELAGRIWFLKD